jgi:hypothetical protein
MCAINRSSIFILLFIQIHLCDLTRNLYLAILSSSSLNRKKSWICRALSTVIPCLLLAISYRGLFFSLYVYHRSVTHTHTHTHMYSPRVMKNSNTPSAEHKDEKADNYQLNVARHAFSCSMRWVHLWYSLVHDNLTVLVYNSPLYTILRCIFVCVWMLFRFSNMGTEWGNIDIHLVQFPPSLYYC